MSLPDVCRLGRDRAAASSSRAGFSDKPTRQKESMMDRFCTVHRIRRLAVLLAGLASVLMASCIAVPAAFARIQPPSGGLGSPPPTPAPQAHVVISGGMPGWQITMIAVGAALAAAVVAVILDRSRVLPRHLTRAAS